MACLLESPTPKEKLKEIYPDFETLERDFKNYYFIKLLLSPDNFDFANKPKAVLPFHLYETHIATPIEEHLNECAFYAASNSVSHLHFTVSENHEELFQKNISEVKILDYDKQIQNYTIGTSGGVDVLASVGQALMQRVQPIHQFSSTTAKVRGPALPFCGLSAMAS